MTATYENIATTTLSSAAGTITFNSIAASWTDLRVILTGTSSVANYARIRFNNDSGTNYSCTILYGDGGSVFSTRETSGNGVWFNGGWLQMSTTIPSFYSADIFSYAGSTNKTFLTTASDDRNGSGIVSRVVGLYRSTSAITRIDLSVNTGNFAAGTTATLFGIKAE